jgi:hypothetical protein
MFPWCCFFSSASACLCCASSALRRGIYLTSAPRALAAYSDGTRHGAHDCPSTRGAHARRAAGSQRARGVRARLFGRCFFAIAVITLAGTPRVGCLVTCSSSRRRQPTAREGRWFARNTSVCSSEQRCSSIGDHPTGHNARWSSAHLEDLFPHVRINPNVGEHVLKHLRS